MIGKGESHSSMFNGNRDIALLLLLFLIMALGGVFFQ